MSVRIACQRYRQTQIDAFTSETRESLKQKLAAKFADSFNASVPVAA